MNEHSFQQIFRNVFIASGLTQSQLAMRYKLDQGHLSRLLRGETSIGLKSMSKLWPFVYGLPFPQMPESPPGPIVAEEAAEEN